MTNDIRKQWNDYTADLSSKIQYLIQTNPKFESQISEKLSNLINCRPPSTTIELQAMKERGDELLSACQPTAFESSSNHEEVPMPTESVAEQAEKAKEI